MKPYKYYVDDGTRCSVEYGGNEQEAKKKWGRRFNRKPGAAKVSCISGISHPVTPLKGARKDGSV